MINLRVWIAAIAVVVVATFWNSQRGVFLFDDFASIHQNSTIRQLSTALTPPGDGRSVAGRPLANLSLAVNYAAGGLDVRGYHVVNILLHLVCAWLAFSVLRRLLVLGGLSNRPAEIACAVTAIWAVHPLQTEVVDYIVARTESLMAACFLLCIDASLRAYEVRRNTHLQTRWHIVATIAAALGMLCKESMATVPLAVMLIDRALLFPSWAAAWRARRTLYLALLSTLLILAALAVAAPRANSAGFSIRPDAGPDVSLSAYLLNQALIVPHYFKLLVWPADLVLDYGYVMPLTIGDVAPYVAGVLAACAIAGWLWRAKPRAGLPFALCLLLLAPTSLVPIITEVGAERRMYLTSLVAIAAVVIFLARAMPRALLIGGAAVIVLVLATLSIRRNAEYASTYGMWQTVVERRPHGRAYLNLAVAANEAGRGSEVLPLLRKAVVDFPDAEHALGERLYQQKQYAEAIEHLETFLRLRATHVQAEAAKQLLVRSWTDLAIQRSEAGRLSEAHDAFESALELDPTNPDLLRNLAISTQTLREAGLLPK